MALLLALHRRDRARARTRGGPRLPLLRPGPLGPGGSRHARSQRRAGGSSRRSSWWRARARRYPTGSRPVPRPSWSRSRPAPPRSRWRCSPCAFGRTGAISGATSLPHGRSSPLCRQDCRSAPRRPASPFAELRRRDAHARVAPRPRPAGDAGVRVAGLRAVSEGVSRDRPLAGGPLRSPHGGR